MFLLVIRVVSLPTQHLCFDTQKFYWTYAASPVHILYGRREYYITAPQCEMLRSKMLYWFAYFVASRVCGKSIFLPSMEYRINVEVECYHSYNNCYILITRMVSLLSPYHHTHCLPDHILLTVLALQGSHD